MRKHDDKGAVPYVSSTCVWEGRTFAVVRSVSEGHIVSWCVDQAEARDLADRLNARPLRGATGPWVPRQSTRTLRFGMGRTS